MTASFTLAELRPHRKERDPSDDPDTRMNETVREPTFESSFACYQSELYRYAYRLTQHQADADDLLQESMLKAFRGFEALQTTSELRAWFYTIVTNTFVSQKRKTRREQTLDDGMAATLRAPEVDLARSIDAQDTLEDVRMFVDELPEKQRAALVLRKYHEFGYGEIALMLDSSEDAARANVYEAVRKLRRRFGDRI